MVVRRGESRGWCVVGSSGLTVSKVRAITYTFCNSARGEILLQYSAMRTQPKTEKGRTSGIYITDSESDSKMWGLPEAEAKADALGLED